MTVRLDNAQLTVGCECECNCSIEDSVGPLDWTWDGVDQYEFDVNGEIECNMQFEDINGKWLCPNCATKAKDPHG